MIGRMILRYKITEKLGEGGMGVVYKAEDTKLKRDIAIKFLPRQIAASEEERKRFKIEAQAAAALNHPNIATIHAIEEVDDEMFIVMEYIEGRELRHLLKSSLEGGAALAARGVLPIEDVLNYAAQIAAGLQAAHEKDVTHRDIKSANIMITDKGQVKIMDFGLAKVRGGAQLTKVGTTLGTAAYMSPEQARGEEADHRSDIWAFGVVLYEMLTGKLPFGGDYEQAVTYSILNEEPESISSLCSDVPTVLEAAVHKTLAKNPSERYQNIAELLSELNQLKDERISSQKQKRGSLSAFKSTPRFTPYILTTLVTAVILVAAWLGYQNFTSKVELPQAPLKSVPFTSYAGVEQFPSFSPDGSQVVFSRRTEEKKDFDIYVKLVGTESASRLTNQLQDEFRPVWSPDGRYIAFLRVTSATTVDVILVPARGGAERRVAEIYPSQITGWWLDGSGLAWHPQGKWLAVSDRDTSEGPSSLFLLSVDSGEKRRLTAPPKSQVYGDAGATFAEDGQTLLFIRATSLGFADLYSLELTKEFLPVGEPKRLTAEQQTITTAVFIPGGEEIIYTTGRFYNDLKLWRTRLTGSDRSPQMISEISIGTTFALSPQGDRLVYQQGADEGESNIWRFEVPDTESSNIRPTKLITSTRDDFLPQYSPNGEKIAFTSNRSGSGEVWVCDSDGSNLLKLTSFGGPACGTPRWSPDGRRLVLDSRVEGQSEIYTISANGGKLKRLTTHPSDDMVPSWSRDGNWIYFASGRTGTLQVWKIPANGGEAVQVTQSGGTTAFESPDGEWLYYAKELRMNDETSIWKVPVAGGREHQVLASLSGWPNFAVTDEGIYFTPMPDSKTGNIIQLFSFDTGEVKTLIELEESKSRYGNGLCVAPDSRSILLTTVDRSESDLYLIENFR